MIFVDTGAWYALSVTSDADHAAATTWLSTNRDRLMTTDYVLNELLTLLRARGENEKAIEVGRGLLEQRSVSLVFVLPDDVRAAFDVFAGYGDKKWSFTDCVSYTVMRRLDITTAFSFDQHFRQFGTVN